MATAFEQLDAVPGYSIPVHRALTEHILLGGAPRSIAILNGTLAGAVGLGLRLWLVGLLIWADRAFRGGVGRQARSALRRGRPPSSAHPRSSVGLRRRTVMMNLAEYRRAASRLADYLPWAALVAPGVVLEQGWQLSSAPRRFRGPDLDTAVAAELVAVAGRINNAFRRLGSGWSIFVEAQRHRGRDLSRQHLSRCCLRPCSTPSARPSSRKRARISCRAIS